MISDIIRREGGDKYTNDPDDPGGPTKYGITLATLSAWRHKKCTAQDVKNMSELEAREIYRMVFYLEPGYSKLSSEILAAVMMDAAVNHGPSQATKQLQRALGFTKADTDGSLGPKTLAAVAVWPPLRLAIRSLTQRGRYYSDIVASHPVEVKFLRGWINRAMELIEELT